MSEMACQLRNVTDLMVSIENKWGGLSLSLFIGSHIITVLTENKNIWLILLGNQANSP
jgi:hypothetical protein